MVLICEERKEVEERKGEGGGEEKGRERERKGEMREKDY